jgi:hypothetical protein
MFDNTKVYEIKLKILKYFVKKVYFKYLPKLGKQRPILKVTKKPDTEKPNLIFSNFTDPIVKQFFSRFTQFRTFERTATFRKSAGSVALDKLNLQSLQ